ncbi:CU044_5270 family protein [Streptomyces sp. NPDC005573]|uniref:CU044_5270 family protein n=1 Tax=Streptomyces sp. NPDC005573 TaxID=3156890 RepID=UPI0033BC4D38
MDEMTEVRGLRAGAPLPDRARLAPGRARLAEAARAGERRRTLWRQREFVITGVVAAVAAVAVTASLLAGAGAGAGRKVRPAAQPALRLEGMSAAAFLRSAADVVDTEPDDAVPTAEQWIYTRRAQELVRASGPGSTDPRGREQETWLRYDGTATADRQYDSEGRPQKLSVTPLHLENGGAGDERSPRELYRVLAALPAGGERTLKVLREKNAVADGEGESRTSSDYAEIAVLLSADVMPSKGLASLYRALATLPGGRLTGHLVRTATGRRVVALSYARGLDPRNGKPMREEWLIDPRTYRITGTRTVEDGRIIAGISVVAKAVVREAGDRG